MADACMPERFYELAHPMLPAEKEPSPDGGRPPIRHQVVLKVIWFVLVTGCRGKDVPQEMGCCGETARTRMQAWERAGIGDQLHRLFLTMLNHEKQLHEETAIIDTPPVRAFGGGDATGPSPVDRRKKARNSRCWWITTVCRWWFEQSRRIAAITAKSCPPCCPSPSSAANPADHARLPTNCTPTPDLIPKPPEFCCAGWKSSLTFGIAMKNTAVTSHLGRVCWVVERTISWIKGLRRMRVRYDRSQTSIDAWTSIAAAVVCLQILSEVIS